MEKTVQEMKALIRELILEIADLKNKVAIIENELNSTGFVSEKETKSKYIAIQAENYEHIGKIYQEGYHVCRIAFGESRVEECLFCLALLGHD